MTQGRKEIAIGGQAVIEGVMMRGPDYIATAIRRKDKSVEVKRQPFISYTKRHRWAGLPLIRGFVSLIEMMRIGIGTLTFSAQRAMLDDEEYQKKNRRPNPIKEKAEEYLSFVVALALAFLLFAWLPYRLADWLDLSRDNLYFNLFTGIIRIIFFVIYIWIISFLKDVKRLFQYHGAEHRSVHAYEKEQALIPAIIQQFSTIHPRCGTSFMFFVLLVSILVFSGIDTLVSMIWTTPAYWVRLIYHISLIPLISGLSYELLRFSAKKCDHPIIRLMIFPGISLQRITTQPPDDEQVEVAVIALKAALEMDLSEHPSVQML
ncbi:MAG: DUF1385 domain-containing protein [Candidatus Delongbacteria bacterium]|nr:DUF1385 domain-containing protein [Candidatus Delongbacteria bacterium]